MKAAILGLLTTLISVSSFATSLPISLDQYLAQVVTESQSTLEKQIKNEIIIKLMTSMGIDDVREFKVDWKSLRCVAANAFETDEKVMGTCVVTASAWQVRAEMAINVGSEVSTVTALTVDVE
jgi:hypothetical protein